MAKKWYVIHTYSGHENKVKVAIETKVKNLGLEERIGEVKIPTYEDPYLGKDGKKKVRSKKMLPGYVLISMELDDETWSLAKSTPGVTNFVGAHGSGRPESISDEEVNALLFGQQGEKSSKDSVSAMMDFVVGEHVKVVDGPFNSFAGVIEEIYPDKGRLRVKVEIFGRGTPVELSFLQVGKI